MSVKKIDARGCSCPEPVLMVKKIMEEFPNTIEISLDSTTAVQNVTRFSHGKGYKVTQTQKDGEFFLHIVK